ncbi:MAG TPA: serine hydrolase, partial [Pyrinomonadaceae bacterium]|nr:serine hydrolase [Pyrinomonadaceae bacterium]
VAAPYIFDPVAGKTMRAPLAKTDSNMQSAGGMFASASDIGRWLNMNMNDGKLNGKQVIPADIVRAAHTGYTPVTRSNEPFVGEGQYGLGWQIGKYRNETVIYHHGGFPGYASHISYLPEKKIAIAVLVNGDIAAAKSGHILATYGYDWWLQTPDLQQSYDKQLEDTVANYAKWRQGAQASAAERAKRTSQLTRPVADYAGTYRNDTYGTIEITAVGNDLSVKMGNMNAVATPFTQTETIRVELIPGQGEVIKFVPNADGKFASIMYGRLSFEKVLR